MERALLANDYVGEVDRFALVTLPLDDRRDQRFDKRRLPVSEFNVRQSANEASVRNGCELLVRGADG